MQCGEVVQSSRGTPTALRWITDIKCCSSPPAASATSVKFRHHGLRKRSLRGLNWRFWIESQKLRSKKGCSGKAVLS